MASSPTADRTDWCLRPVDFAPLRASFRLDSFEHCEQTGKYRGRVARGYHSPSMALVEMVEAVTGRASVELPPLAEMNAPESIDQLFARPAFHSVLQHLTFQYEGFDVTLYGDRTIELDPR